MKRTIILLLALTTLISCSYKKATNEAIYPKKSYKGVKELFGKYKCDIKLNKLATTLKTNSSKFWANFKTAITDGAKKEVNFGGKYIIATWGCGTECQTGVIINAATGEFSQLPTSEWSIAYKKDSLLLIINPPAKEKAGEKRPDYAYPAYYLWNTNKFKLLHDTRKKS